MEVDVTSIPENRILSSNKRVEPHNGRQQETANVVKKRRKSSGYMRVGKGGSAKGKLKSERRTARGRKAVITLNDLHPDVREAVEYVFDDKSVEEILNVKERKCRGNEGKGMDLTIPS